MTTPTPGAYDAPTTPPDSPAEVNRPPATLPWQDAARFLAQPLGPVNTEEVVRRACEQWARSATAHWRQHDADMHKALALCRSVLEECRPMVKAHLLEMERFGPGDESIVGRIEQALTGGAP